MASRSLRGLFWAAVLFTVCMTTIPDMDKVVGVFHFTHPVYHVIAFAVLSALLDVAHATYGVIFKPTALLTVAFGDRECPGFSSYTDLFNPGVVSDAIGIAIYFSLIKITCSYLRGLPNVDHS